MISAFMEVPSIFGGAEFVTERAAVAARFDMLRLNMFPQSCLVAGCPQTILALPQLSKLAHLLGNCSLKLSIYQTWMNRSVRKKSIFVLSHASHALVISTFVVMPCILGRAKLRAKWTIIALACNMFCLYVFPKTCLVLGCPQAVLALPQITSLAHLWRYFRIKI